MRSKGFYILVILLAIGLTAVWFFLKNYEPSPVEEDVVLPPAPVSEQVIEQDWISFSAVKEIQNPVFDIEMEVLKPLDRIDVIWSHPSSDQAERYSLKNFASGNTAALYKVSPSLGNLLPGENTYEVIGVKQSETSDVPEQEFRVDFTVQFDLTKYQEMNPRFFTLDTFPTETDSAAVVVRGTLQKEVAKMQVYSFHPRAGQATFAPLYKYDPTKTRFEYFVDEKLGNFFIGDNQFVIEALDAEDKVVARKFISVRSTKLTLEDEVKELFGEFTLVKGGWYVSSTLPWFSLRPVYDSIWIADEEGKVVVPRPTLMYTTDGTPEQALCDYLKGIDYEKENYSYRGYSYETCQKFRFGVTVYDRFLSILEYQPFELVKRTEYKDIEGKVSSAFVMIETGGMSPPQSISFDETNFSDPEKDPADQVERSEKYYLYQMLIQQSTGYEDKKIGDIAVEMSPEQQAGFERVKNFLNEHSGDELFTNLLFPPKGEGETPDTSPSAE